MHLGYTPYIILMLVAAVISAALAAYVWQRRSGAPGATALGLLMISLTVWLLAEVLCLVTNDLFTRLIWAKIEYIGIVSAPVIWLVFILQYTGRQKWLTHRKLVLLIICPIITLLLVWTNEMHGLIWEEFSLYQRGSVMVSEKTYGVWFWIQAAYSYVLVFSGAGLIVRWAISSYRLYRRQVTVMLIGALVPLVGNLPYILNLGSLQGIDPTPITFTISGLMLALGLFRFRLLDIIPVARETIIKGMSDGLLVLDEQNRIVDMNLAAEGITGITTSESVGQPVDQLLSCWTDSIEGHQKLMETKPEILIGKGEEEHCYDLRISPLYGRNNSIAGRAVIMHDITELKQAKERLEKSFINLAETVSRALELRDPYTAGHQRNVAELARRIAEELGLDRDKQLGLYIGGLLHDVGKVSIPASILAKPGELTQEEWALIRSHPKQSYNILKDAELPWPIADIALHHHERLDGSGYPDDISGDELSQEVRIIAVCDVVEAMSAHRPYRPARSNDEILEEIRGGRGTIYDTDVIDVMLRLIGDGELDSIITK